MNVVKTITNTLEESRVGVILKDPYRESIPAM